MKCIEDLTLCNNDGQLPIDVATNEAIKRLLREEYERRLDHGLKRAVVRPPSPVEGEDEIEDGEPDSKRPRLEGEGSGQAMASATSVAEEEEDSEVSSDEDEDEK